MKDYLAVKGFSSAVKTLGENRIAEVIILNVQEQIAGCRT